MTGAKCRFGRPMFESIVESEKRFDHVVVVCQVRSSLLVGREDQSGILFQRAVRGCRDMVVLQS